jgi:hypothetical protein
MQKALLGPAKDVHVHRSLASTQDRTQSNHQNFKQIVPSGVTGPRIFKAFKARRKCLHPIPHPPASISRG